MNLHLSNISPAALASRRDVEIVERKGLGHPDTICDALAEELSRGLCRFYLERFGLILHHNVDKVLLWGGAASPAFGGGEVLEPMEIYLAGRATTEFDGVRVPVHEIAHEVCDAWLQEHLHTFDPRKHVKLHVLVRPGSADLVDLFLRQQKAGIWLANDTSCGVGYAPLSTLEHSVLAAESVLVSKATTAAHPALGEDVKVMGIRSGERLDFTVACALIGAHLKNLEAYLEAKGLAANLVRSAIGPWDGPTNVEVNAADDPDTESLYLTVLGTSAEAGDDGQAGRGNRANGLITPYRNMTMESVAGKNPVTHVGKLYNVAAGRIASLLVDNIDEVAAAQCALVSQIGHPINEPAIVDVQVATVDGGPVEPLRAEIEEVVTQRIEQIAALWEKFVRGELSLY